MNDQELIKQIKELKKKKKAVILVHNYQRPEIFKVADFIGDSLQLCQMAAKSDAKIILFCGVMFMAESAVILNPDKKILIPFSDSGCTMADMVNTEDLKKFKRKHPDAAVVAYVNSSAEVKALADICCTSSNAIKVARSLKEKKIIFVPDKNLAAYVQANVPEKEIIPWRGQCPIHHSLTKESIEEIRKKHPDSCIIAHPECRPEVIALSDYVSSTTGMIDVARKSKAKKFFVITECGMTERLRQELPDKEFEGVCNICFDMKKNDLASVLRSLKEEKPVVKVDKKVLNKAKVAFERMFKIS